MTSPAGNILRHAASIVDGARAQQHGDKERSFSCIAEFWDVYLRHQHNKFIASPRVQKLDGADVAAMMVLMKLARSLYGEPIADHFVDMAGYSAILGELEVDDETLRSLFTPTESKPDEPEVVSFSGNPTDLFNGS